MSIAMGGIERIVSSAEVINERASDLSMLSLGKLTATSIDLVMAALKVVEALKEGSAGGKVTSGLVGRSLL